MSDLMDQPKLGHITTFGGNPVIAAASLATLKEITETNLMDQTLEKEKLFRKLLQHPLIEEVRGKGLMLAAMMKNKEIANYVVLEAAKKVLSYSGYCSSSEPFEYRPTHHFHERN